MSASSPFPATTRPDRRDPHARPRVAVVVPAFGVAHLVRDALSSVQSQTFRNWECVVIDDGAPDDVAGAVEPFLVDSRIRMIRTANHGVSAARNAAIQSARAPLVALLDGDDLYYPDYLEQMTAEIESHAGSALVTCNARLFGAIPDGESFAQNNGRVGAATLAAVLDRSFDVYIGSMFRRDDWARVGGFDPAMSHSEDFDFWVRLMIDHGDARYLDEPLGQYRIRPGSASWSELKILHGNAHTYRKAMALLSDREEGRVAERMLAQTERQIARLEAIARVEGGATGPALEELRSHSSDLRSPVWQTAFLVWRVLPALAAPMLRWRREANARHYAKGKVSPLRFAPATFRGMGPRGHQPQTSGAGA